MSKLGRFLLLGAVTVGIALALTAAPSSGDVRGQATGYGDDVVQPCPPGEDTGPGGEPCLKSFEVATPAGERDGGDSDSNLVKYIFIAGMVLVIGGGVAYLISYTEFLSRFRRS
jgi:hypothetical protein